MIYCATDNKLHCNYYPNTFQKQCYKYTVTFTKLKAQLLHIDCIKIHNKLI